MIEIPVQLTLVALPAPKDSARGNIPSVCATCTKCGRTATVAIRLEGHGGPVTKRNEAKRAALLAVEAGCPRQVMLLGKPVTPPHVERLIPNGVILEVIATADEKRYPCTVAKGLTVQWVGGAVTDGATLVVTPEAPADGGVAVDFANELKKKGYKRVYIANEARAVK